MQHENFEQVINKSLIIDGGGLYLVQPWRFHGNNNHIGHELDMLPGTYFSE